MRALVALLLLAAPALAAAPPAGVLHPACPDARPAMLFASWDAPLENLAFDGAGAMWVSALGSSLLRATSDGAMVEARAVPGMHGVLVTRAGDLVLGAEGDGAEVWRFAGGDVSAAPEVLARGLRAANGLAEDAEGNLYASSPLSAQGPYLARIPAEGGAWSAFGDAYGANGLQDAGDALYAAVTGDQSSDILRLPYDDPSNARTVASLSVGVATLQPGLHAPRGEAYLAPKGLDDLALGPDGLLYATAHVTGELLRVDPATGSACAFASGFEEPTSARFAVGFAPYDGDLFVTDMGGVGVSALVAGGAGAVWRIDM